MGFGEHLAPSAICPHCKYSYKIHNGHEHCSERDEAMRKAAEMHKIEEKRKGKEKREEKEWIEKNQDQLKTLVKKRVWDKIPL